MKNYIKICLSAIVLISVVSLASCTVEYRARHPHHHNKVIVVGMEKSNIPSDSVEAALVNNPPGNDTASTNASKQK